MAVRWIEQVLLSSRMWLLAGASWSLASGGASADCTLTNTGKLPLPEYGYKTYQGVACGLYPNFSNQRPPAHLAAGLDLATNQITPRDSSGSPTNTGKIVLLSIGMSNTTQEWATKGSSNFNDLASADPARNAQVVIVDGARGGQDAKAWTNLYDPNWSNVLTKLANKGVTTNQVQAIWIKQATAGESGALTNHAGQLQNLIEMIARNAKVWYPNLKIIYLSSRTRAYVSGSGLNPEPIAFETGFAVKWMIERQINGAADLNYDPAKGQVVAPWLSWGPYLWADGLVPRSDGLTWLCSDLETDFTHPSADGGVPKVGRQLLAFFKTDPTAAPWFLRQSVTGQPPTLTVSADVTNGAAPLIVNFLANANDPDGSVVQYAWTFDNGEFSFTPNPTHIFRTPGIYNVRVTVTDNLGNTTRGSVAVTVNSTWSDWRAAKFTASELTKALVSGEAANPDLDPFPNLLEYVMGLEPKVINSTGVVSATVSNGVFSLRFPHLKAAADTTLAADVSDDFLNWSPASASQVIDNGPVETVVVVEPVSGYEVKYYRLRATR